MKKKRYFRIGDLTIYIFFICFFIYLGLNILKKENFRASKIEIYVNSQLKFVQKLQKEQKYMFIDTDIGGIEVEFLDNKVRVISSNSPRKLIVKQGWIQNPGDLLIGIPDKTVVKIVGEGEDELDYVAR
ncbi:MAG: NusG domain II-containing protein [Fusobacteriaceae bacterium]